jgi:hypothetical protein
MKINEIKKKAKPLGINPKNMKKADLIHAIQKAEGCTECFGKSGGQCPYTNCCFMEDCLPVRL